MSELCQLNRTDLKLSNVPAQQWQGNIARTVPLPVDARHYISKYLENRTDADTFLFLRQYKHRTSVRSVQHMLQKYNIILIS
ncbi:tyrosine-type recombinase/integrase [Paenibacillus oryzae]|uniref:tyrosine-type recombinase/integrase n=1 Tax=Paenibacillus oryzae TaxID=1844972 RepID=UPI003CCC2DB5